MSQFGGSGTQRPLQTTGAMLSETRPQTGIRDSKYYFEDGSTIFRVGGYLFKIQRSLLSSQSKLFDDMFSLPSPGKLSSSAGIEGTSDANPINIPEVQAGQFRHLLLFLYGNMTDPDYRSLVLDVPEGSLFDQAAFKRYLGIASLAHHFCMDSVETWALAQFKRVMRSSKQAIMQFWDHKDLLNALVYSKLTSDRELESNVRNLLQCHFLFLSSVRDPLPTPGTYPINVLTRVYKDTLLKQQDPALFGHIFCVILSAGHQSLVWKALTRDDRSKLLAAQVYLTPLPPNLPTSWIQHMPEIYGAVNHQSRQICFPNCSQSFLIRFYQLVDHSDLAKDSPLAGITALSKLVTHRQSIAEEFKMARCTCASQLLAVVDLKMDELFTELTEMYHDHLD
ncbi:hypothetical protein FRC08_013215 [Ceratobasidium sp. 394]|nr:hypothetical protein FRC08_013215 [Ceratobasidium sp. 394]KAG9078132.1 hypothetical protein FS749_009913 [Ceratobasidium sp. UAMH 11750]